MVRLCESARDFENLCEIAGICAHLHKTMKVCANMILMVYGVKSYCDKIAQERFFNMSTPLEKKWEIKERRKKMTQYFPLLIIMDCPPPKILYNNSATFWVADLIFYKLTRWIFVDIQQPFEAYLEISWSPL